MACRIGPGLAAGENQFKAERVKKPKQRKFLKRAGRKTLEWQAIRRVLRNRFARAGITRCEIHVSPDCMNDNCLGFLHYDKRRFLTPEELWIVALGCAPCHDVYELLPRPEMKRRIQAIIAARAVQP